MKNTQEGQERCDNVLSLVYRDGREEWTEEPVPYYGGDTIVIDDLRQELNIKEVIISRTCGSIPTLSLHDHFEDCCAKH